MSQSTCLHEFPMKYYNFKKKKQNKKKTSQDKLHAVLIKHQHATSTGTYFLIFHIKY